MTAQYMSADELREQGQQMSAGVRSKEAATPDLSDTFLVHKHLKTIENADHSELADGLMASRRALTKLTIELLKATSPASVTKGAQGGVAAGVYLFDIEEVVDLMSAEIDQLETRYAAGKKILSDVGIDEYIDEDGEQAQSCC
jgi:O-acetyl-ADP-ribose deacetylase (regulator of RNase III)